MKTVYQIAAGIGALIALYLIIVNATGTNQLIATLGDVTNKGIATLQGRDAKGVTS